MYIQKRFLIISPHPDDVELGLGGTILKAKEKGDKIFVIDLTSGEPTPFGTKETREKETKLASRILKIDDRINLGLENRYLFDTKGARLELAEKIRLFRPDILFCPYFEDSHPDHSAATKVVEAARFYAKYTKVELMGEPHYPYHLFYYFSSHLRIIPKFTFLIDISNQFEDKMKAIQCYKSQFIDNPKNIFIFDYTKTINHYLGTLIRTEYAEALYSKEVIKVNDLSNLL